MLDFRSDGAIISWLPLFLFVVLFGLSMDYHVFILSRVREGVDSGMRTEDALRHGISRTAGVVSAAALVMVGVFSLFGTASALDLKEAGVGLAVAVLLDATVVRGVLLPATMKLLGERNWYLPSWLAWLPRASLEGETLEGGVVDGPGRRRPDPQAGSGLGAPIDATIPSQHEGEAVPSGPGGDRGRNRRHLAGGSRRRRSADRAGADPHALVGASLIGCGLASWRERPENRLGPVMVLTGFLWFAGLLSEATNAPLYTLGVAIEYVFLCGFVYIVLSFPSGQLRGTRRQGDRRGRGRRHALLQVAAMLFGSGSGLRCGGGCGDNLIQMFHDNGLALTLLDLQRALGAVADADRASAC